MSLAKKLTSLADRFLQPVNATHRQYEALRAYCVEGLPSAEAAQRFGYTPGSFRVLVHEFRQNPERAFFLTPAKGPQTAPKKDRLRDRVVALRKQNLSIYDISSTLRDEGDPSARPPSRFSSRPRALPVCPDGSTTSAHRGRARRPPTSPTSANSTSPRARSAPSSAGCSCSCPVWRRSPSTGCSAVPASPARR